MEKAIKLAIEGGAFGNPEKLKDVDWFIKEGLIYWNRKNQDGIMISLHKQFLRPEFWQALGKSLGWKDKYIRKESGSFIYGGKVWLEIWHRFITHLAEGKDPESFFINLIK